MKLGELIKNIDTLKLENFDSEVEITGLSYNSKTIQKGNIFICLKGENTDGHKYAKMAYENGAAAFFLEDELDFECNCPKIFVKSTKHSIADLSAAFYENPSQKLNLIGVTGTNGKTTVTHLLQKIVEEAGEKCGLIGTLGYKVSSADTYHEAKHTTPQAPELQHNFQRMLEMGVKNVMMEVSSHALEQNRTGCCAFNGAVLTNLTQDHLDYHITMNNYFEAKAILFKNLEDSAFAVINNDDEYSQRFIKKKKKGTKIYTYGVKTKANVIATNIEFSIHGASFDCETPFGNTHLKLQLNGMFSVYNALAALTTGLAMGIELPVIKKALEETPSVAGRFEIVNKEPLVIVDYAHTPDGLENVLKAAREITPKTSKLICLFGCGGDRDATKRPKMGAIADRLSDKVIVTSDNPRSENPDLIISDIMAGIKSVSADRIFVESDRREAIKYIKKIAEKSDVAVVAGKGHEDYQILKDKTIHFDDREEVRNVFASEKV